MCSGQDVRAHHVQEAQAHQRAGLFTRGAQGQSEVLFIGFEEDGQCVNALFYPTEITKTRFCKLWQLADFGREK